MDESLYFMSSEDLENIFIFSCQGVSTLLVVASLILAIVWFVYFLSRVRELSKKIHYLKKQTDERCCEELTNAKVDYVKSLFIAGICLFEVLSFVNSISLAASADLSPSATGGLNTSENQNCSEMILLESSYRSYFVRGLLALELSSVLVYTSLIHTLTAYLSHAYAEKRVIRLTRGDKVLLLWLLLQLIALWISIAYWRAFILFALALVIYLFPIHLWLYSKYSRRLYQLLKRRRLDAWYEFDPQPYKRLDGMCTEYKRSSILYAASIVLLSFTFNGISLLILLQELFGRYTELNCLLFYSESTILSRIYSRNPGVFGIIKRVLLTSSNLVGVVGFFCFFLLHFLIAFGAVKRALKRRRGYKTYTGTRSHPIYQPLIGTR